MFTSLLNALIGCAHRNTSFPITPRSTHARRKQITEFDTYVVCLDCGKEMPYSWEEMKVLTNQAKQASAVGEQVGSFSVTK